MKLREIAEEIRTHLARIEADPTVNVPAPGNKLRPFYCSGACSAGSRIFITYVSYQGPGSSLTRDQTMSYLEGLRSGYVGRHYEWARRQEKERIRLAAQDQDAQKEETA